MFFWSKLASVYNHCFGFVSLLIKRAAPSVWFLQESIKRPIRCCVSQGTDPRSAVRQRQTLCWGLSYAGVKIKAVSMECDLWTHFLANSADFMWENSNMYITEEHGVFQKMNARLIWGFSTVHVSEFCLNCCIFILLKKENSTGAVTDKAFTARLLEIKTRKACLTFPHTSLPVCLRNIWHLLSFNNILNLHPFQCGFFTRSLQDDSVPRYHAVRIKKETPEYKDGFKLDSFEKKPWVTTWSEFESYSWTIEASALVNTLLSNFCEERSLSGTSQVHLMSPLCKWWNVFVCFVYIS